MYDLPLKYRFIISISISTPFGLHSVSISRRSWSLRYAFLLPACFLSTIIYHMTSRGVMIVLVSENDDYAKFD